MYTKEPVSLPTEGIDEITFVPPEEENLGNFLRIKYACGLEVQVLPRCLRLRTQDAAAWVVLWGSWPVANCAACRNRGICLSDGYTRVGPFCESYEEEEEEEDEHEYQERPT